MDDREEFDGETSFSTAANERQFRTTICCPKCASEQIAAKNRARKLASTIGTVAGAASAAAACMPSAEIGATVGLLSGGPIGAAIGGIAGAVVGALIGGAAGCIAGAAVGEVIDDNVLDNFHCLSCDYIFSKPRG